MDRFVFFIIVNFVGFSWVCFVVFIGFSFVWIKFMVIYIFSKEFIGLNDCVRLRCWVVVVFVFMDKM